MADEKSNHVKLGLFVALGAAVLVVGLYLMGSKQDLFTSTIDVTATFRDVGGLSAGSNVRYAGIDVGTVEDVEIVNDTTVIVHMMVRTDEARFIRTDATVRIGSDGLMGNKLVDLEPGTSRGQPIQDGALLMSSGTMDTDAMLRTLSVSNDNLAAITTDLRELTRRISGSKGLVSVLSDTAIVGDVQRTVRDLRGTAANAREITQRVNGVVRELQQGKGALGALMQDPTTEDQVRQVLENLQHVSDSLLLVSSELGRFSSGLNDPRGLGHALTQDTAVAGDLRRILSNLDTSSVTLNEDLKALQRSFLMRKYFKEKEREEKKKGTGK